MKIGKDAILLFPVVIFSAMSRRATGIAARGTLRSDVVCVKLWCDRRASAAVEFGLVAPLLILLTFGIYAASYVMATVIGIEQITAGAARNAVAGVTDTERQSLALSYVTSNASAYAYIDPTHLTLSLFSNPATAAFTVTATYDLSSSGFYRAIKPVVPTLQPMISRSATIQQGGY